jgi:two-component system sensor histidine kinase KdpD
LRLEWFPLEDLVNAALDRLGGRLAGYTVTTDMQPDLPQAHVDGALVLQVLTNLMENVVKHTRLGAHVFIRGVLDEAFIRVDVEDDGPGLPAGDPEQLFAKFHRGRDESNAGGAGLGLSICRAIISAHGGRISAAQRPGGGARFSFTLPTA